MRDDQIQGIQRAKDDQGEACLAIRNFHHVDIGVEEIVQCPVALPRIELPRFGHLLELLESFDGSLVFVAVDDVAPVIEAFAHPFQVSRYECRPRVRRVM